MVAFIFTLMETENANCFAFVRIRKAEPYRSQQTAMVSWGRQFGRVTDEAETGDRNSYRLKLSRGGFELSL